MRIPSKWLSWLPLLSLLLGLIQPLPALAESTTPTQPDTIQGAECPTNAVDVDVVFPAQLTDWDETQTVTAPTGKIIGVLMQASTTISSTMKAEHTGGGTPTLTANVGSDVQITVGSAQMSLSPLKQAGTQKVSAFDGTVDYAGTSGVNFGTQSASDQKSNHVPASIFAGGSASIRAVAEGKSSITGSANLAAVITNEATAAIKFTFVIQTVCVGGTTWYDSDLDGIQDASENTLSGLPVQLMSGTSAVDSTTTDSAGSYRFDGLMGGDYSVVISPPSSAPVVTSVRFATDDNKDEQNRCSQTAPGQTANSKQHHHQFDSRQRAGCSG